MKGELKPLRLRQSPEYQGFKGPLVLTPVWLEARTPLTEVRDPAHY
jgi:hypothetical protein